MTYNISNTCQIENLSNIYEHVFGFPYEGFFVEVGAYDGEFCSNTSGLSDFGWNGLYIEPIQRSYELCYNRHYYNKAEVIRCSIGSVEGEINFYNSYSRSMDKDSQDCLYYQYSTSDMSEVLRTPDIEWMSHISYDIVKVPQYRLEVILKEHNVPKNFDILVVDVEGNEYDVMKSFSIDFWKPKMIIIELKELNEKYQNFLDYIEECKLIRKKIISHGYKEIYKDDINTIFLDTGLDIPSCHW
jgi:FkbM family methyltransferase